jgi:hypothetical protein
MEVGSFPLSVYQTTRRQFMGTERRGHVASTPALYSKGPVFTCVPEDGVILILIFPILTGTARQNDGIVSQFKPQPFSSESFLIHYSLKHSASYNRPPHPR